MNWEQCYFCNVGSVEVIAFPRKCSQKWSENLVFLSMTYKILHQLVPTHISQLATTPPHILYFPNTKNLLQFSNYTTFFHNSVFLLYPRFGRLCSLFKCYIYPLLTLDRVSRSYSTSILALTILYCNHLFSICVFYSPLHPQNSVEYHECLLH